MWRIRWLEELPASPKPSGSSPDLLLVLGDRYEVLAAAQAAMVLRIPIAHIHSGESTEAAIKFNDMWRR